MASPRPARWLVELRQHPNCDVEIRVRTGGYGGAGQVGPFPPPGPREIVWLGSLILVGLEREVVTNVLVRMWTTKFGPLLKAPDRTVHWAICLERNCVAEWWAMPYTPRIANAQSEQRPGEWGTWNKQTRDFAWRPTRLLSAM